MEKLSFTRCYGFTGDFLQANFFINLKELRVVNCPQVNVFGPSYTSNFVLPKVSVIYGTTLYDFVRRCTRGDTDLKQVIIQDIDNNAISRSDTMYLYNLEALSLHADEFFNFDIMIGSFIHISRLQRMTLANCIIDTDFLKEIRYCQSIESFTIDEGRCLARNVIRQITEALPKLKRLALTYIQYENRMDEIGYLINYINRNSNVIEIVSDDLWKRLTEVIPKFRSRFEGVTNTRVVLDLHVPDENNNAALTAWAATRNIRLCNSLRLFNSIDM